MAPIPEGTRKLIKGREYILISHRWRSTKDGADLKSGYRPLNARQELAKINKATSGERLAALEKRYEALGRHLEDLGGQDTGLLIDHSPFERDRQLLDRLGEKAYNRRQQIEEADESSQKEIDDEFFAGYRVKPIKGGIQIDAEEDVSPFGVLSKRTMVIRDIHGGWQVELSPVSLTEPGKEPRLLSPYESYPADPELIEHVSKHGAPTDGASLRKVIALAQKSKSRTVKGNWAANSLLFSQSVAIDDRLARLEQRQDALAYCFELSSQVGQNAAIGLGHVLARLPAEQSGFLLRFIRDR